MPDDAIRMPVNGLPQIAMATGPQGPTGPTGPQGPAGPQGEAGYSGAVDATFAFNVLSADTVEATIRFIDVNGDTCAGSGTLVCPPNNDSVGVYPVPGNPITVGGFAVATSNTGSISSVGISTPDVLVVQLGIYAPVSGPAWFLVSGKVIALTIPVAA